MANTGPQSHLMDAYCMGLLQASNPRYLNDELLSNLVFKTVIKQRSDLTQLPQYHP